MPEGMHSDLVHVLGDKWRELKALPYIILWFFPSGWVSMDSCLCMCCMQTIYIILRHICNQYYNKHFYTYIFPLGFPLPNHIIIMYYARNQIVRTISHIFIILI